MDMEFWKTILLGFVTLCASITTVCVAAGWLIKIIKAIKKPSDDIRAEVKSDTKRITELERQFLFVLRALPLLLQDDLVILNHLRTSNNTGEMAKQEAKVQEFLLKR